MEENINVHIGYKLKTLRISLDISQNDIAQILGVSFQQIQKYENGCNRISAASLFKISKHFHIPVTYFFEDIEDVTSDFNKIHHELFASKDILKFARSFNNIKNLSVKKNIITLLHSLESAEL